MSVEQENLTKQKYLKNGGTIFFISLMAAFVPLSTDLYLPALNDMCDIFNASYSLVNMTLTMFFFFYAVGIVLWGPLSDKYGRKKILIIGNVIYLIASIVCALAPNVYVLLTARIFHGLGAGAITSISLALVKDCYSGSHARNYSLNCTDDERRSPDGCSGFRRNFAEIFQLGSQLRRFSRNFRT